MPKSTGRSACKGAPRGGCRGRPDRSPRRRQPPISRRRCPRRGHARYSGRPHHRLDRPRWRRQVVAAGPDRRRQARPGWQGRGAGRRHGQCTASQRDLPAHRLHAARPGKEPLSRPQRPGKHRLLRPTVRPRPRRTRGADRRAAGQHGTGRIRRPAGQAALRRDAPETRPVLCPDPRPGPADPRRAHDRGGSVVTAAVLATHRSHAGAPSWHEHHRGDGLHGGSGTVRLAGRHECRQGPGRVPARRAQGKDRGRHDRGRLHRPAAR